ncbi:(2,3-dihydroxybenzoyl)adenylate synthase [Tepidibacter hydrothermalis]|uniref:AMP-binding protein n=1 Tax=Tepidibacter hydrothermalis TaxID=3036126 RepID=A0ABY8EFW0_9FIRM|nr:AMP-binding protein [Tepidibacter hydrothermalis]WFD11844.1 AMP-binding protein [Tepidibacter hydrothermalis]
MEKIINYLEDQYNSKAWEKSTLGEALDHWAKNYGDSIAIIDNDKSYTYKTLLKDAQAYAMGFLKQGYKKGDKIVLQLSNCYDFVAIAFGMFKVGIVPIMALPAHRAIELKGIFELSQAVAYIIQDRYLGYDYRELAREIKKDSSSLKDIFVIGDNEEFKSVKNLKVKSEKPFILPQIDHRELALLLLSGGTTGIPKLIPRRHTDYLYVGKMTAKRCQMTDKSIYLAALPIAHNFPLGCPGLIGTLNVGGKVVMCQTTSPDEIIPLIEEQKVTITGLVPAMAVMCMEFINYDDSYDISSLKVLQIGGSVLDSITAEKIENVFGCKLQQIFGIAEGLICCTALDDPDETVYNCQGKPISEMDEVIIVDENENEVETGGYGELIVRGPYTIFGYYNLPEINKEQVSANGYFRTGDKARKLENGNYQVAGRMKELINRAGEKITPSELEETLLKHDRIREAQVVGIRDKELGERICAFLLKNNVTLSLDQVRVFLSQRGMATFKLPDQLIYVESWPLTSVGKINKKQLKIIAEHKIS